MSRRIGIAVAQLWLAMTIAFFLVRCIPGDPVAIILGSESGATPEQRELVTREFGLDQPLFIQYATALGRALTGDLGFSFQLQRPVIDVITEQLGSTLALSAAAFAIAAALAISAAVFVPRRLRWLRGLSGAVELLSVSIPSYWLGILLMSVFSFQLRLFPVIGSGSAGLPGLVLPAIALAIPLYAPLAQVLSAEIADAETQPFATSVRARGATRFQLRIRHTTAHGLVPSLTLLGGYLGALLGGSIIIEQVFGRPGLGSVALAAVITRDTPVITGIVLLTALFFITVNLLVESAYRVIDPRTTQ